MAYLLLVFVAGFIIMSLAFLLLGKGLTRPSKWLGVIALAFAAPFFYWLGLFSEQFSAGLCYSDSIHKIANAVQMTDSPGKLAEQIRGLPLHGYETVCSEVQTAASQLPHADAPENAGSPSPAKQTGRR